MIAINSLTVIAHSVRIKDAKNGTRMPLAAEKYIIWLNETFFYNWPLLSSLLVKKNLFIEAFEMKGFSNPNNFVLFNGEDLSYHPGIDYSTNRNARIAEMSSLKKKIFLSRDIFRVDQANGDYISLQISSTSFEIQDKPRMLL